MVPCNGFKNLRTRFAVPYIGFRDARTLFDVPYIVFNCKVVILLYGHEII